MQEQYSLNHPIVEQSFKIIDEEIGQHNLSFLIYLYLVLKQLIMALIL